MPRAKRRLGQHFLTDPRILAPHRRRARRRRRRTPCSRSGPGPADSPRRSRRGPGGWSPSRRTRDLVPALRAAVARRHGRGGATRSRPTGTRSAGPDGLVAGNIPYNITSPLIDKALEPPRPARIVFLVQKEVADRVGAAPGERGVRRAQRRGAGGGPGGAALHRARRRVSSPAQGGLGGAPADAAGGAHRGRPTRSWRRSAGWWSGLFGFRRKQLGRGLRELTGWDAGAGGGGARPRRDRRRRPSGDAVAGRVRRAAARAR